MHLSFVLIVLGLPADAIGLSLELTCKPMISDSTPNKGSFRQIECETSTCVNVYILQYEKRGVKYADQWTPVFKSMNNTHHALDTGTEYTLRDRSNYVTFLTKTLLYIKPLKPEDHGMWRCVVYDNGNQKYESRGLDVNIFEPAMVLSPKHATIVTTDVDLKITLNCSGSGLSPRMMWKKDDTPIFTNDTRYITTLECSETKCEGSLTIKPVEKTIACANKDMYTGTYTCVISLEPPYKSSQSSPNMVVEAPMNLCDEGHINIKVGILSAVCIVSLASAIVISAFLIRRILIKRHHAKQQTDILALEPLMPKNSYFIDLDGALSPYHKLQITIAIDFGTTYCGYAYNLKHHDKIWVNKTWEDNNGCRSYKVPTCVLSEGEDDEFVAFGYEAQRIFSNENDDICDSDSDDDEVIDTQSKQAKIKDLHFYDEFKMVLDGDKEIGSHIKCTALDGHECEASKIFTMALNYLKDHILEHLRKYVKTHKMLEQDEITWIITVPIIWSDGAKQFMRQCAVKAGIISYYASEKLLIALEPEAASLYCKTLDHWENIDDSRLVKGIPRDSNYMVVDCGGGTVDITVHHFSKKGEIREMYTASGKGCGGRNINRNFEEKLIEVLGEDVMKRFKKEYHSAYLDMKTKFEKDKKMITLDSDNAKYVYGCPLVWDELCKTIYGEGVNERVHKHSSEHHVTFSEGKLKFDKNALAQMFTPLVNDIKSLIFDLVAKDELQNLQYIILVGGFSEWPFLHKEINREFTEGRFKDKNIKVTSAPWHVSFAVLKGAVIFGNNPNIISSRRAQRYYYYKNLVSTPVDIESNNGDILSSLVKPNDEIFLKDPKCVEFYPKSGGHIVNLYSCKLDAPDKSREDETMIPIDVSNIIETNKESKIRICLYLGGTEIYVTACSENH